jgi:glycosyltransferase involved in cell wall biosynthesis
LAKELQLTNVDWIDWAAYPQLRDHIAGADVCLGIFATTDKAQRVIPNKVYQALASRRPLITADTPAARELLLRDQMVGALLVPAADEKALARALLRLAMSAQKRAELARDGYALYRRYYSSKIIGGTLLDVLATHPQSRDQDSPKGTGCWRT